MLRLVLLVVGVAAVTASQCSQGEVEYMCANIDECWRELAFSSRTDLEDLCGAQGYGNDEGQQLPSTSAAIITTPPKNITVSEGDTAQFRCSADNTIKINIVKKSAGESSEDALVKGTASTQTTIQEIESAMLQHEGWYVCRAYDADGIETSAEAYLEIRDICAASDCQSPQVCKADEFTGTYECVCPGECDNTFAPVCGSDCASYFNECTMKKETCEKGLVGVTVVSQGLCTFTPVKPRFEVSPVGGQTFEQGGAAIISARASGTPEPVYQWFKGEKLIGEGSDFTVSMSAKLAGTWRVEASNCHYTNKVEHEFEVKVEASSLVEPDMQCCKVYGDPHIMSFDKLKWDYMGSCTYVLAQYILKDLKEPDFLPPFYSKDLTKSSKDFTLLVEYSEDDDDVTRKKKCCRAALYKKCWKKAKRQDELFDAQLESLTTQTKYYQMMIDNMTKENACERKEEIIIK